MGATGGFEPRFAMLDDLRDRSGWELPEFGDDLGLVLIKRGALLIFAAVNLLIVALPLLAAALMVLGNLITLHLNAAFSIATILVMAAWLIGAAAVGGQMLLEVLWDSEFPGDGPLGMVLGCGAGIGILFSVLGLFSMLLIETRSLLYLASFIAAFWIVRILHRNVPGHGAAFWVHVWSDALHAAQDYLFACANGAGFILWSQTLVVWLSFYNAGAPLLWATTFDDLRLPKPGPLQAAIALAAILLFGALLPRVRWIRRAADWYARYKMVCTALAFVATFSLVFGEAQARNNLFLNETYHLKPIVERRTSHAAVAASIRVLQDRVPLMTVGDFHGLESIISRSRDNATKELDLEAAAATLSYGVVEDSHAEPPHDPSQADDPEETVAKDPVFSQEKDALVELIQEKASEHLGHALDAEPLSFLVQALIGNVAERISGFIMKSGRPPGEPNAPPGLNWEAAEDTFRRHVISTVELPKEVRFTLLDKFPDLIVEPFEKVPRDEPVEELKLPKFKMVP